MTQNEHNVDLAQSQIHANSQLCEIALHMTTNLGSQYINTNNGYSLRAFQQHPMQCMVLNIRYEPISDSTYEIQYGDWKYVTVIEDTNHILYIKLAINKNAEASIQTMYYKNIVKTISQISIA